MATKTPTKVKTPKSDGLAKKLKGLVALPFDIVGGMLDDVVLGVVLPKVIQFVTSRHDWKAKTYRSGYTLGVKIDNELDRLLKGRGEMVEDPFQEFKNVFNEGLNDGLDHDEGAVNKYPVNDTSETDPAFPDGEE